MTPPSEAIRTLVGLPPSLAVTPNIAMEHQTLEQLRAERDYWMSAVDSAAGFASANAADGFRQGCEAWIARREREAAKCRALAEEVGR